MPHPAQLYGEPDLKIAGLSVWAISREFPQSDDYLDGNWLNIHARVEAPGARVDVSGPWLRIDEIMSFRRELAVVNRDLKGTAELACIEPILSVKLTCGSLGHVEVTVEISPEHLTQSHRFVFALDQTYLGPVISACNRLVGKFPLKGDVPGN
jgi:hypothetical protein